MKRLTQNEIKTVQLNILKAFAKYCEENSLRYFLVAGTLLGAVRHKGFIPWDDDIDVGMPRPDYNRLLRLSKGFISDHYRVDTVRNNKKHSRLFTKIVDDRTVSRHKYYPERFSTSLGIDVFPIDGIPETENSRKKYFRKLFLITKMFTAVHTKLFCGSVWWKSIAKTIFGLPCRLIGRKRLFMAEEIVTAEYPFEDARDVGISIGVYRQKEILGKKDFTPPAILQFEDQFYSVPRNYDKYLSNLYGNYMELPPDCERKGSHNYMVWWK